MAKQGYQQKETGMQLRLAMEYIRYIGSDGSAALAASASLRESFVCTYSYSMREQAHLKGFRRLISLPDLSVRGH